MTIPRNLSNLAPGASTGGVLSASYGGTGLTSPGTAGNALVSNGTDWVSQAVATSSPTQQIFTFTALTGTFARAATKAGTYSQITTTVTVTFNSHGFIAGDRVYLDFTSGTATDAWFTIATATTNTFTVTRTTATTSGNVTIYPPVIVTVNNHGQSTGSTVYVDYSATFTDAAETIYQATTNTFQTQGGTNTGGVSTSGTVTLSQIGTSQTWSRPSGCKKIVVQLVGGGGGIQVASSGSNGGGYSQEFIDVTSISSATVTIGGPGLSFSGAPVAVIVGGTTSFGVYLSATGGGNGAAGLGSGGDINLFGQFAMTVGSDVFSGGSNLGSGNFRGFSPIGYGAGGNSNEIPNYINGTPGVVFVMEYY
jgi:hypothetical protein